MITLVGFPNSDPAVIGSFDYGQLRNATSPGAGDGSPWRKDIAQDIYYAIAAVCKAGGQAPNGSTETTSASQFLNALKEINKTVTGNFSVTGTSLIGGIATFSNTTDSTSSSTGAVVISGGLGVAKNITAGGIFKTPKTFYSSSVIYNKENSGTSILDVQLDGDGISNYRFQVGGGYTTTGEKGLIVVNNNSIANGQHLFTSSNATSYMQAYGGNLAIGGTTADEKLHVYGNFKLKDHMMLTSNGFLLWGTNPVVNSDHAGAITGVISDYLYIDGGRGITNGAGAKGLRFRPINAVTKGIWNDTGLRIGDATSPTEMLDVYGNIKASGSLQVGGNFKFKEYLYEAASGFPSNTNTVVITYDTIASAVGASFFSMDNFIITSLLAWDGSQWWPVSSVNGQTGLLYSIRSTGIAVSNFMSAGPAVGGNKFKILFKYKS